MPPHHTFPHKYSNGLKRSALLTSAQKVLLTVALSFTHQFFGSSEVLFCERWRIRSFPYLQWIYLGITSNTSGLEKMGEMRLEDMILGSL